MKLQDFAGYWWIAWFGIIAGFFMVALPECVDEVRNGQPSAFSIALISVLSLSWVAFFVAEEKVKPPLRIMVVNFLTLTGSILAVFTLLGIFFFVQVAPRLR